MTWSRRIAILLCLGLAAWSFSSILWKRWQQKLLGWQSRRSIEDTVRSTAYPLSGTRWLEFDLPSQAVGLRLLTNAAVSDRQLPPLSEQRPRRGWQYAVDYQLIDDRGQIVEQQSYHFRTRMSHGQEADTDFVEGPTWFQDSTLAPASTRTVQVPLQQTNRNVRRFRVRCGAHDPQVQEVVARLYFKYERPDYDRTYAWSRLPVDARRRLSRASVYPPELLTPWEKRNLLRWNWTALPPPGQNGVEYEHRLIYQREKPEAIDQEFLAPADGVVCRPNSAVTIPTPLGAGVVRMEFFHDFELTDAGTTEDSMRVHHKSLGVVAHYRHRVDDLREPVTLDTDGDLLEITSNKYLICAATWRPRSAHLTDAPITLNSSAQSIRALLIDPTYPIEYEITHVNQLDTPFRVTFRTVAPRLPGSRGVAPPQRIAPGRVTIEFMNRLGHVLRRDEIQTLPEVARYDRAAVGAAAMFVSEPSTWYVAVPLPVTKVRLRTDRTGTAVIAFTRPIDVPRIFRVPEEQSLFERQEEIGRSWFLLRPTDYRQRVAENRCAEIEIQDRPQPANEELISGQYEWEDHRPREFARGRFVLTLRDPPFVLRDDAIASAYYRIPVNRTLPLRWSTAGNIATLEPRLIYLLTQSDERPLRVFLNDKLHFQFVPRARQGEVSLPKVPYSAEPQTVRIETSAGTEVFLRNVQIEDAPCYVKRFVHQQSEHALTFDVVKHTQAAEQWMLRTFFAGGERGDATAPSTVGDGAERFAVHVRLLGAEQRGDGLLSGWSLDQRVYAIAPQQDQAAIMLDGIGSLYDQGVCPVLLGEDLPRGRYQLEVRPVKPTSRPSFVSLYRIRPNDPSQRESHIDQWNDPAITNRAQL
jgi:hypothetical protein